MEPMKTNRFIVNAFQDLGLIHRSIPGKAEYAVPLVNFLCEPFLQAGRRAKKFEKYGRRTSHRIFQRKKLFFAHLRFSKF
jgi:hypothetical protein